MWRHASNADGGMIQHFISKKGLSNNKRANRILLVFLVLKFKSILSSAFYIPNVKQWMKDQNQRELLLAYWDKLTLMHFHLLRISSQHHISILLISFLFFFLNSAYFFPSPRGGCCCPKYLLLPLCTRSSLRHPFVYIMLYSLQAICRNPLVRLTASQCRSKLTCILVVDGSNWISVYR